MPASFPGGLAICEAFHRDVVAPLLREAFPQLRAAAGLLGPGSEVLGFDTAQSTDHEWVPRVLLFASDADAAAHAEAVRLLLAERLPGAFAGHSTHFAPADAEGIRIAEPHPGGPVDHGVRLVSTRAWLHAQVGFDPLGEIALADWLGVAQQRLLGVTAGRLFDDPVGELTSARERLGFYPNDVWLELMAAQWTRIAQQEAFVGRCGDVGDERGSRLVAARLVDDLVGLAFLQARRYAPYAKWRGSAFARLDVAARLGPLLDAALDAPEWRTRERAVGAAGSLLAEQHNRLGVTPPLETELRRFHARPYAVLHADRFAAALRAAIADEQVRALPTPAGGVDQWVDSTDVLAHPARSRRASDALAQPR